MHGPKRDRRVNLTKDELDHLAAVVDLGDDAVGLVAMVRSDCNLRPFMGLISTAQVLQHIAAIVMAYAGDENSRLIQSSPLFTAGSIDTAIRFNSGDARGGRGRDPSPLP